MVISDQEIWNGLNAVDQSLGSWTNEDPSLSAILADIDGKGLLDDIDLDPLTLEPKKPTATIAVAGVTVKIPPSANEAAKKAAADAAKATNEAFKAANGVAKTTVEVKDVVWNKLNPKQMQSVSQQIVTKAIFGEIKGFH